MTVRTYFRQLRRAQWELDPQFFYEMFVIFPPRPAVAVNFCETMPPRRDPTVSSNALTAHALFELARAMHADLRRASFYRFHRDVAAGLCRIKELVEPEQELSADVAAAALQSWHADNKHRLAVRGKYMNGVLD